MRLHDLLDGLDIAGATGAGAFEVRGDRSVEIRSVEHDSRAVAPGALFCCIPGARADGHDFAPAAVADGAVACLEERPLDIDVTQIRTPSVRRALGPVCARFHGSPSRAVQVLGVTGTNGKTTTTYLLERVIRESGQDSAVIGTTGVRIGDEAVPIAHTTPEATDLQALLARIREAGVRSVAMEVSSHALDQFRVDGTWFAATCFTNLSHDHLDYHRDMEEYFEAKARLFTPWFTGKAAIRADDPFGPRLVDRARNAGLEVCTYAVHGEAVVVARDLVTAPGGTSFTIVDSAGAGGGTVTGGTVTVPVRTPLVGSFNVANVLGAYATARLAGFAPDVIGRACSAPLVVPGRMERVEAGQDFVVLVDYAHTPDALGAALAAAREIAGTTGRVLLVFGCGGDRDRTKRPLMGALAARASDQAYLTSDNPRSEDPQLIANEVCRGAGRDPAGLVTELDRRRAIGAALAAARPGDVVLIAGKGHESGQTAQGVTVPFDDRAVAQEILEGLR